MKKDQIFLQLYRIVILQFLTNSGKFEFLASLILEFQLTILIPYYRFSRFYSISRGTDKTIEESQK